jgi:hypothetical protein
MYVLVYVFVILGGYSGWRFFDDDDACESFQLFFIRKVYTGIIFMFSLFMVINIHLNFSLMYRQEIAHAAAEHQAKLLAEMLA